MLTLMHFFFPNLCLNNSVMQHCTANHMADFNLTEFSSLEMKIVVMAAGQWHIRLTSVFLWQGPTFVPCLF